MAWPFFTLPILPFQFSFIPSVPNVSCFARRIYQMALLLSAGPALAQAPVITAQSPLANTIAAGNSSVTVSFSQPLTPGSAVGLKVFSSQRGGLRTRLAPGVVSGNTI